ncbi:MAG: hypothetical protein ACE5IG_07590 [Dehalococcoidia bacterium]
MAEAVQSLGTVAVLVIVLTWMLFQWREGRREHHTNPDLILRELEGIRAALEEIKDQSYWHREHTKGLEDTLKLLRQRLDDVWDRVKGL